MKKMMIALLLLLAGCSYYAPKNGDVIFQTSLSNQSRAVQLATRSPYSHMGIVYVNDGAAYVFEASKIVQSTPLANWIKRGEHGR